MGRQRVLPVATSSSHWAIVILLTSVLWGGRGGHLVAAAEKVKIGKVM